MRIALVFPGCHRHGGVERIVLESARFLASRNHDVHVFANEWEADSSSAVHYRAVPIRKFPGFLACRSFHRNSTQLLVPGDFDAVGTFGCECPTGGVMWVQSLHRAWLRQSRSMRRPWSIPRIRQRLNPLHPILLGLEQKHFGLRTYRKVIATTPQVRNDLSCLYGVPAEDIEIVSNGFSPDEFNPRRRLERREEMRSKLGLQSDEIVLLFVANELDRKGYATLLDGMRRLGRRDVRLLVVGRPDRRDVCARAEAAGVGDQVIACGLAGDVAAYHAAADIFVLPTQYEAFCLAILEALGSGIPVVTTDVPGARDAIVPGVNGSVISDPLSGEQLKNALEPMLDRDLRQSLSASAPASVAAFQWPVVLERYERVLQQASRR